MAKKRLTGYTFDASAKTVVQASFSDVTLEGIQLIVNVTDQIIIYNFADSTKGGTLSTDTLTLEYDTTSMSDTDELMILVEDGLQETVTAELSATDNAVLDAIALSVSNIDTDTTTLIGHVDGIETLLGTIDADTSNLNAANQAMSTGGTAWAVTRGMAVGAYDGTNMIPIRSDNNGELIVNVDSSALPTGAATSAKQDTIIGHVDGIEALLTTIDADTGSILTSVDGIETLLTGIDADTDAIKTSVQLIDDTIFADDAAFTLGTSKGSVMEGVAVNTDGTDPSAVSAEGDAAALRTDMNRILLVNQTHPRGTTVSADYASAQTNVSVIAAPGASLSIYITDIQLSNGATAGNVTLLDGSGGTVKWEAYPAINGGAVLNLRQPIKLTANTALCLTSTTVTTHSIFIGYYIAA